MKKTKKLMLLAVGCTCVLIILGFSIGYFLAAKSIEDKSQKASGDTAKIEDAGNINGSENGETADTGDTEGPEGDTSNGETEAPSLEDETESNQEDSEGEEVSNLEEDSSNESVSGQTNSNQEDGKQTDSKKGNSQNSKPSSKTFATDLSVSKNGKLQVLNGQLCNKDGTPIQLKGMSTHGIAWFGQFANKEAMKYLKNNWGISVFRIAMYTDGGEGYVANPDSTMKKVTGIIDAAIELDMYVIIDWHILNDNDPNKYINESKTFFDTISKKYKDVPNLIYEICNEPNGSSVTWSSSIKPYANTIIPIIRNNSKDAIVIVGTGTWSQDVLDPASDPLPYNNIMYALHFYSGTHTGWLRDRADAALKKGIAIFVTEWGTSDASGNGGTYLEEAQKWIDFMDSRGLSWCNWSLCDKNESSAALMPGANTNGNWTDDQLSPSGKFVKAAIGYKPQGQNQTPQTQTPQTQAPQSGNNKPSTPSNDTKKDDNTDVIVIADSKLVVKMYNGNTQDSINTISPRIQLENNSNQAIDLSKVKIRYYFSADGSQTNNFWCDWSAVGSENITYNFVKLSPAVGKQDYYVEIGFKTNAGKLEAGKSIEIQCRIAKNDWSNYSQFNDYSFLKDATAYQRWGQITAYLSGELVWGKEPN